MRYLWLFAFALSLWGCSSRSIALKDSVESYVKAIRRGDSEMALAMVHPTRREEFSKNLDRLDRDLMVSQFEIKSVVPDDKMENAVVTFLMEYFDQSSSHLVVTRSASLWKYDEKKEVWFLESATPLK